MLQESKSIKVSVIITAFNVGKYLSETLDGVLKQKTDFDIEILIGEDGSADNTEEIVNSYASRYPGLIRAFCADKNQGVDANFFNLMGNARGKYIAQIDGDEIIVSENKLQLCADFLDAHPDFGLCVHNYRIVSEEGQTITAQHYKEGHVHPDVDSYLQEVPPGSMVMIRRSALPGPLPEWLSRSGPHADYVYQLMASIHSKSGYLPEVLMAYRTHPASLSNRETKKLVTEKNIFICKNLMKFYFRDKEHYNVFRGGVRDYSFIMSYLKLSQGKVLQFIYYFLYAQWVAPTFSIRKQKDYLHIASPDFFYKLKRLVKLGTGN